MYKKQSQKEEIWLTSKAKKIKLSEVKIKKENKKKKEKKIQYHFPQIQMLTEILNGRSSFMKTRKKIFFFFYKDIFLPGDKICFPFSKNNNQRKWQKSPRDKQTKMVIIQTRNDTKKKKEKKGNKMSSLMNRGKKKELQYSN